MNFVDMVVYNRLYKELVSNDSKGGTKISRDYSSSYATPVYGKFSFNLGGKVNLHYVFSYGLTASSWIYVYLTKNGGTKETIVQQYRNDDVVGDYEIEVSPGDVFEFEMSANANVTPSATISAWIVDKEKKYVNFVDTEE